MHIALTFFLSLVTVFAGALPAAAQTEPLPETLRIGTEGAYRPFNYTASDGTLVGFDIEITRALCAEMKVSCTFVPISWDGLIPALLSNRIDAIAASLSITETRKAIVSFTQKYYHLPVRFVTCRTGITDVTPEALAGYRIGTQAATTSADYLQSQYSESTIRLYDRQTMANMDLRARRIDLVLANSIVMLDWLQKEGRGCRFVGAPIQDEAFFGSGTGIALRQEDEHIRAAFDRAIQAIIENGRYEEINARYFPFSIY